MRYAVRYRSYTRSFRRSLTTAHGVWSVREGVIIELRSLDVSLDGLPNLSALVDWDASSWNFLKGDCLNGDREGLDQSSSIQINPATTDQTERDQAEVGLGEVAPLPWFGSETLAEALDFCRSLAGQIDDDEIDTIPDRFPACQFAFESARSLARAASIDRSRLPSSPTFSPAQNLDRCRLLPAGRASLAALDREPNHHIPHTYKWKIATESIDDELTIFSALGRQLPPGTRLRLDANGGLSYDHACRWLEVCDRSNDRVNNPVNPADRATVLIEFLEQPLPPAQWSKLLRLSQRFATPIALDESIANLQQLRTAHAQGWSGIYVIKPAIIGSPQRLRSLCTAHPLDTVFSSVFETAIGRDAGLRLAQELQTRNRAIGYGLDDWLC